MSFSLLDKWFNVSIDSIAEPSSCIGARGSTSRTSFFAGPTCFEEALDSYSGAFTGEDYALPILLDCFVFTEGGGIGGFLYFLTSLLSSLAGYAGFSRFW